MPSFLASKVAPCCDRLAKCVNASLIGFLLFATALFTTALSTPAASAQADDWPGFHGLGIAGVLPDARLPEGWEKQAYRWTFDLKTRDVGSMAIQNGRVYLLSMSPAKPSIRLISINLGSGKVNWTREFPHAKNHLHSRNTLASSTPATDGQHVYVAHSDRQHTWLRCLDHQGNEIWQRDFGMAQSQHGFGVSPTVHGETVVLNFSQQADRVENGQPGTSRMIAVHRSTGETIWQTPVTSTRVCYGTPAIRDGKVICANTGDGIYALSLETGKMLWRLPVFKMRCVSSPVVAGDLAIGSSGSGGGGNHLVAVRMPASETDTPQEVYRIEKAAPYVPTSVVHDGMLFTIDDKGIASCYDVATGNLRWTSRIGGTYSASPIVLGDKVLVINLDGEATVLRAAGKFEKLSEINLGGPVGATPAYANGRLLLRVGTELRCL
ncbi:outer membrane biogenesis protein BamB [Stieleria maiorica]|uniref:Outer membrane biogenesis protein BamB n=1 Tax=Stieleria maiorica TaxID=2795974 RepID=A0A5B9MFV5_9BACT|nr:PQQ-binding-like beta-propeller repeat protein [Stieleria maiorica]QEF98474.1 outer membrane biogenesis protein BamB [Stieleria maiorica]